MALVVNEPLVGSASSTSPNGSAQRTRVEPGVGLAWPAKGRGAQWLAAATGPLVGFSVALAATARYEPPAAVGVAIAATLAAGLVAWRRHEHMPALSALRSGASARMFEGLAIVGVALTMLAVLDPRIGPPVAFAFGTVVALGTSALARVVVEQLETAPRRRVRARRVIAVGDDDEVSRISARFNAHRPAEWEVVGAVREPRHPGRLIEMAQELGASGIVVAAHALDDEALRTELAMLARTPIDVHIDAGLHGFDPRRVRIAPLGHDPLLTLCRPRFRPLQLAAKRTTDVVLATVLLILAAPVLALAVIAIKLEDRGPVLFAQTRVGRDGRPFRLLKLRTMHPAAESRLAELRHLNERDGPLFKLTNDPRVTRVGRVLRATSIDELPQLFHVIGGSMSLVGPRPALPSEVITFDDRLAYRHAVRPGITGLWQVEQRDSGSFSAYRELDLFYVENWTLMLDLAILVHTMPAVVGRAVRALRRAT